MNRMGAINMTVWCWGGARPHRDHCSLITTTGWQTLFSLQNWTGVHGCRLDDTTPPPARQTVQNKQPAALQHCCTARSAACSAGFPSLYNCNAGLFCNWTSKLFLPAIFSPSDVNSTAEERGRKLVRRKICKEMNVFVPSFAAMSTECGLCLGTLQQCQGFTNHMVGMHYCTETNGSARTEK